MDAKFCQADREISFDLTKIRGLFNEIAWRTFVKFSRDQRAKSGEFCFHFFYTVLYNCKKKNASFTLTLLHLLSFVYYKLSASYRGC